ncbi:MAG: sigma-70 family RNA polymerase sigma factor [Vicinamibacterales bacterium]
MPPQDPDSPSSDITQLLDRWGQGDPGALDAASAVVYPELRRIADAYLRRERADHTLQPTALVHEAYLRLQAAGRLRFEGRRQFYALAAQIMRRILVDHARAVTAKKRGGAAVHVPIDGAAAYDPASADAFLVLHDALERLARFDARKARVIELRYFGGLTLDETAQVVGVSTATAQREQRLAEAWLTSALSS